MFSKQREETVDWGIRSKIQSTGTQFPRTGDNAKHPIEEFRNDSCGIIGPRGQSTERKHCPPTVFDANTVKGHAVHPFHETIRSWLSTEDDWKPAQSNKTPPCTRFDRLLEHRHDLGYTLFLGNPEIPDRTSQVNSDHDVSPGGGKVKNRPVWTKDFLVESTVSESVFSEKLPPVTIMTNLLSPWNKISDTFSIKITPTTLYNLIFQQTGCNITTMKLPPIKVGVSEY